MILLPVSYFHKSNKTYSINVTFGYISETFDVKVNDKEFTIQYLTIDTKIAAATRNDERQGGYRKDRPAKTSLVMKFNTGKETFLQAC